LPDIVDPATRSRMMSGIRAADTAPERIVRSALHRLGFRFRLRKAGLPGRPDLVLPRYRVAVFVHGCFWHGHDCALFRLPKTRREFWETKIGHNRERDERVRRQTLEAGWRHLAIWECAFRGAGPDAVSNMATRAAAWIRGSEAEGDIRGPRSFPAQ
jgi:DNA mismatch endonuclease (patch repair protein)